MDNNPFRSGSGTPSSQFNGGNNFVTPTYGQQPQQPQHPYGGYSTPTTGGYSTPSTGGYSTPTGYGQQPQAWQNNVSAIGPNTPYSPIASTQQPLSGVNTSTSYQPYNQQQQQQPFNQQQPYNQQQQSFTSTPYQSQTQLGQQPFSAYNSNTNSSLMSSTPSTISNSMGGGVQGNTYQPYGATTSMPTPDQYQTMYGGGAMQQQQQPYNNNNSNFYIPPNFGQTTTNYQPQQPRHAPVDASTLLKGTQVRRVECPVCQKMIEGDDMAVNHHVNEHYS